MKVGWVLWGDVLDNREAGVPCVREGAASYDLAEEDHRDRPEAVDRHQGEDSSYSEAAGGSSYYVTEAVPFVQAEDSLSFEVEVVLQVPVEDSSSSEAEVVPQVQVEGSSRFVEVALRVLVEGSSCSEAEVPVLVGGSCYEGELAQG